MEIEERRVPQDSFGAGRAGGPDPMMRVPPQNLEAEQNVLGAMLLSPDAILKVLEIIRTPEVFYRQSHQIIYKAVRELTERGEPADLVTVSNHLEACNKLDAVGGRLHLADLYNSIGTIAHAEYYARIVVDKAMRRSLIRVGSEVTELGYQDEQDTEHLVDQAEQKVFELGNGRQTSEYTHIEPILHKVFENAENRFTHQGAVVGTPTGFYDLDNLLAGFQPGALIILGARPAMGKCLAYDSEIVLEDGSLETIEDIYRRGSAQLLTLGSDWKLGFTAPSHFVDDGQKPVFRVTTRLGRTIETTLSHPFLTIQGWKPLKDVAVGTRVGVPRHLPVFGTEFMRECEVKILAYLIGDGGLSGTVPMFTNTNDSIAEDFNLAVEEFGGVRLMPSSWTDTQRAPSYRVVGDNEFIAKGRAAFAVRLSEAVQAQGWTVEQTAARSGVTPTAARNWLRGSAVPGSDPFVAICKALKVSPETIVPEGVAALSRNSKNPLTLWLGDLGLMGKKAAQKAIPPCVFRLERDLVSMFLSRLFATDGWASVDRQGATQIGYLSASERLVRQIAHLLLRFGILAAVKPKRTRYRDADRIYWQLVITDIPSLLAFVESIGIYGKEEAVSRVSQAIASRGRSPNFDTVPVEIWSEIRRLKGAESWASLAKRCKFAGWANVHAGKRAPTRARLGQFAEALGDAGLRALAQSDVYWDEIVSIEAMGLKQVYDLTIPDTHNFVANDMCVHNTSLAMSLARNSACGTADIAGKPVIVFSLEMSRDELVMRMLSSEARVNMQRLKTGFLSDDDWPKLLQAIGRLQEWPIYLDDSAAISVMEVRSKCRKLMSEIGTDIGLVVIDYLQLMDSHANTKNKAIDSRAMEVAYISRSLKALARELRCPIMALSQLSRASEQSKDKKPMLSHLRESGSIEQDADVVMFIHRDDYYNEMSEFKNQAEIIVAKNRNGPTGGVMLYFHKEYTLFDNLYTPGAPA